MLKKMWGAAMAALLCTHTVHAGGEREIIDEVCAARVLNACVLKVMPGSPGHPGACKYGDFFNAHPSSMRCNAVPSDRAKLLKEIEEMGSGARVDFFSAMTPENLAKLQACDVMARSLSASVCVVKVTWPDRQDALDVKKSIEDMEKLFRANFVNALICASPNAEPRQRTAACNAAGVAAQSNAPSSTSSQKK